MRAFILDCESCGRWLLAVKDEANAEKYRDAHAAHGTVFVDNEGAHRGYIGGAA